MRWFVSYVACSGSWPSSGLGLLLFCSFVFFVGIGLVISLALVLASALALGVGLVLVFSSFSHVFSFRILEAISERYTFLSNITTKGAAQRPGGLARCVCARVRVRVYVCGRADAHPPSLFHTLFHVPSDFL
jgi:hypothetical protein